MAMFLSRLKQILNLGTKSITANGTYSASSDGYDGYNQVSVNMPSITPSNSNPATLTANNAVTPTDHGYAIQSYTTVYPISLPSVKPSGFIKLNSNAWIVDNMTRLYPLSYPQPLSSGNTYYCEGKAQYVDEIYTATPSDSTPDTLLIDKTYYMNNTGYLYATKQKIKTGTVTLSTSATTYVNIGFKPKYIGLIVYKDNTHFNISIYNENISDSYTYRGAENTSSNMNCAAFALPTSSTTTNASKILSIDSTGFTIDKTTSTFGTMAKYFAIGEEPTGTLPPMNVTVHHGSSSVSNYATVDNIGYTKLKLVSSTATTSAGNQYAIDNDSLTSVSIGSTVSIPSTGQVKLYLNRTGDGTAVWQFTN